jgi:hypothetical protein
MTVSSEVGHMTMPTGPGVTDGPLTVQTNFYEFRAVEGSSTATRAAHELELGGVYEIVVTTCTGLYRYSCGDQFRVTNIVGGVPSIDFVGRMGVSDLAGEKITEQHVIAALRDSTERTPIANATFCAIWGAPSHYVCVVEPQRDWGAAETERFSSTCEVALRKHAPRYDLKRGFGDLGPLVVHTVPRGTFDAYRQKRVASGVPGTQVKDKVLHERSESSVLDELLTLGGGR